MRSVPLAAALALSACVLTGACTVTAGGSVTPGKTGRTKTGQSTTGRTGTTTAGPTARATVPAQDGPRRVVSAATAGGLPKGTGDQAVTDVPVDPGEVRDGMNLVIENYVRPGSGDPVLLVAVDGVTDGTEKRREHLWRGLLDRLQWDGGVDSRPVAAGPLGGSVECFLVSLAQDGNVVCGWADATTAGIALIPDSTVATASRLFLAIRADVEG
ncbi:hypothetical protein [Actinocorallia longicatena]|uniref:Lipoprotein n=1 Tax=Actinocorallia longicatena TaxID=111803 RepID=A0ABP6Q6Y2_9ACTN